MAPDQRGYGETDAPEDVDDYTQFHLVGDMVGLVAAFGEEHELQHDVAASMRKFLFGVSGDAQRGMAAMAEPPHRSAFMLPQLDDCEALPPWLTEEELGYFAEAFRKSGFRGGLNWYRNLDLTWELSSPFQGRQIAQPALFISGDRDLIRNNPGFEEAMRQVATNLVDVVILPGIGHWTQQEAPQQTNEALISFLDGL